MSPKKTLEKQKDNKKQSQQKLSQDSEKESQRVEIQKKISKPSVQNSGKPNISQRVKQQNVSSILPFSPQQIQTQIKQQLPQFLSEIHKEDEIQEITEGNNSKKFEYDLEKGLRIDAKPLQKHFKFNKSQDQIIPIMVSVKTLDQKSEIGIQQNLLEGRPNIDLVCVIDNSGSMSGTKIQNVKYAILQLMEMLNENDRLSLILFNSDAQQLCGLKKVNQQNKQILSNAVNSIYSTGGTNITSGLQTAFSILQNRTQKNSVSSIFLLSDGQDNGSEKKIKNLLQTTYLRLQEECFTIHSFGFGNDHDGPLMQNIAQLKDGSFYYVEKNDQVDEFFIDALGGLFSVVAQDLNLKVQISTQNESFQKFFKKSYISQTYGGSMWTTVKQNEELSIKINQIFSGVSKDFIFEITVPKSEVKELQDFERNLELIKVQLNASPINPQNTSKVVKENNLVLTLFTENEQVAQDSEINDNVEFNYLRVKAAQAIEEAIKYADKQQYNQGQIVLSDMLKKLEKSHPNNQTKLKILKEDLIQCQQNVQPQQYQFQGKFHAQQQCVSHYKQQSQAIRQNDMYQIQLQQQMVQQQQQLKQQQQTQQQTQQIQQFIQWNPNLQQQTILHGQQLNNQMIQMAQFQQQQQQQQFGQYPSMLPQKQPSVQK